MKTEGGTGGLRRRLLRGFSKLGLAAAALLVTLVAGELVTRIVVPPPQLVEIEPAVKLAARPRPAQEREEEHGIDVLQDWGGRHGVRLYPYLRATIHDHVLSHRDVVIETDSLGLRHPELGPKGPDELRVLVMGDSITFGDYLPFAETFTAMLQGKLADRPRRVVVINAGLPGASTSDELYHYLEVRDAVDPDLVLVGMYLNDAQNGQRFHARALRPPYSSSRFASFVVNRFERLRIRFWAEQTIPDIDPDWQERFRASRALRTGDMYHSRDAFDFEVYNAHDDFGLAWNPQFWEVLRPLTRTFALSARQRGQRFAVFLFPIHIQAKGTVDDFRPQQSFLEMCQALDLTCLDLLPALRADWRQRHQELYFDHCHLTAHGNAVVAAALATWLTDERLVP